MRPLRVLCKVIRFAALACAAIVAVAFVAVIIWIGAYFRQAFIGSREFKAAAAPFVALGAEVQATGGGDMGVALGRDGIVTILCKESIGDAELVTLAKRMGTFSRLQTLRLEGDRVTNAGIAQLKGLHQLRSLLLTDTRVTPDGIAELRQALPNLSVTLQHYKQ